MIPTRMCLIRRGVLLKSYTCALCQNAGEPSQHLFVKFVIAQQVWSPCYKWIGILFVQHQDMRCHFENFHLLQVSTKQNLI